jgi:hypothetical protein
MRHNECNYRNYIIHCSLYLTMTPTFFFFSLKNVLREIIKKKVNICIVNEGISRIKIYIGLFYEVQTEYWETKFFTMRGECRF